MTLGSKADIVRPVLLAAAALVAVSACGPEPTPPENASPKLSLDVGSVERYVAGEDVVEIRASATDPDGDSLEFSVDNKPERASLQTYQQEAVLTWRPISSDVTDGSPRRLTFLVQDEHGATADEVVQLEIRAGNGLPQFQNSSNKLYDVGSGQPLQFEVRVRDDDSEQVRLLMPPDKAPRGATFQQTGPEHGEFQWSPSPAQEESRVHSVTFVADDGDNRPVSQEVTIIFTNDRTGSSTGVPAPDENCGENQPIQFEPLSAQHTLEDYSIEATLSQAAAQTYDRAAVLWTTRDPYNNPDIDFASQPLEMQGTELRGAMPNLKLQTGKTEVVHYAICALDEDAPKNDDDKIACSPESLYHAFLAYSPDDETCIDDGDSNGTRSNATLIPANRWRHSRGCKKSPDLHTFEVESGETVTAYVSYPRGSSLSLRAFDSSENSKDSAIEFSDCLGLARLRLRRTASQSAKRYYLWVKGDDVPYQTTLKREGNSGGNCSPDAREPNDSTAAATAVTGTPRYPSLSICPSGDLDVFAVELLPEDVFGADLAFDHGDGDVDATLFGPNQNDQVGSGNRGLAESWSSDDGERLAHTAKRPGTYHLAVFTGGKTNDYSLEFDTTCRSGDAFTRNHTQPRAALPQTKTYRDLKICSGEPDWYERTVFDGQNLSARLEVQRGGQLEDAAVSIYDADGNEVATDRRLNGGLEVDYTGRTSPKGQYFIRVSSSADLLYSLEIRQQ